MKQKGAFLVFLVFFLSISIQATAYISRFEVMPDRIWTGPNVWANPMEDWRIKDGRLECISPSRDRNVQLLTNQLSDRLAPFHASVQLGVISGKKGAAGFLLGLHDNINDYRGNLYFGKGIKAIITTDHRIMIGEKFSEMNPGADLKSVLLQLKAEPQGNQFRLILTAIRTDTGKVIGQIENTVSADRLKGNIALVHNPSKKGTKLDACFWFKKWTVQGAKLDENPKHAFGPILFSMYTLNNSRSKDAYIMKITAQMPPIGKQDSQTVKLQANRGKGWDTLKVKSIDPDSRTATFKITNWPADRDVPYRLCYTLKTTDGKSSECQWDGTIRKDPIDHPLVIPGFTGHFYRAFPFTPVVRNVEQMKPDLLFFSGDQIYEGNGNYGLIREPADRAILCYLRKWYLFGWTWREQMRSCPAICLPDDHDVFQGNLWGEGGKAFSAKDEGTSTHGGYAEPIRMVNVVHRTNCAHQPDPYDPKTALRGLSVYYTDLVYGRVSFALLADRQFKSGPENVKTDSERRDWVDGPSFDISKLDKPGLTLLGKKQCDFLENWVADWRGADMKVVLSQTLFANAATQHGTRNHFLQADLDSGGWPQSARDRAIRIIRKGYPLHYDGDQHLATLIQYGVDAPRDSCWSFCTPAVCSIYQRWWLPDETGRPHTDRPADNLPNTGQYLDGLGNMIYVDAVANPDSTGAGAQNRYKWADDRAGGFANVIINTQKRTYTCKCYHFLADLKNPKPSDQFPGWPLTINQRENYGRKIFGYLPEVSISSVKKPVLYVYNQKTGKLVYAIRLNNSSVTPWVFEKGIYTVKIGDPDADTWKIVKNQKVREN